MAETKITNREIYNNVLSNGTIYGKLNIRDLRRFADTAKFLVPEAESILDVGCFCGEWLNYVVAHKQTIQKHLGIEVAQNKVDEARKQYPHLNIQCEFAEKLNLPPQSFDVVTCLEVLEHIPDWQSVFNSLFRFASRQVLITVPCKELIWQTPCIHCGKMTPIYGHLHSFSEKDFPKMAGWHVGFAKLRDKSSRPILKGIYRFFVPNYYWLLVSYRRKT